MATEAEFRELLEQDRVLIRTLLSFNFPGSRELMAQLPGLLARRIDENGSLEFRVCSSALASVRDGPVVEGNYPEEALAAENPICVNVLLHVREGKLRLLEIYKDDSSPLAAPLNLQRLVLFSPLVGERRTVCGNGDAASTRLE